MAATNQVLPASGLVTTGDGDNGFNRVLLCGITNGSIVVPIQVKADGSLVISGA
jgi:hypothetical protein